MSATISLKAMHLCHPLPLLHSVMSLYVRQHDRLRQTVVLLALVLAVSLPASQPVAADTFPIISGERNERGEFVSVMMARFASDHDLLQIGADGALSDCDLSGSRVTDEGIETGLSRQRLRFLDVSFTDVTLASVAKLTQSFATLEYLDARGCKLGDAGVSQLTGFRKLRGLHLSGVSFSAEDIKSLQSFKDLRTLSVAGTDVSDEDVKSLSGIRTIETLILTGTNVTDAGLRDLAALPKLKWLIVGGTRVSKEGIASFRARRPDTHIKPLFLSEADNQDWRDSIRYFAKNGATIFFEEDGLVSLSITGSHFSDDKIATHLKQLTTLQRIEVLYCRVGEGTLEVLARLPSLQAVRLFGTNLSPNEISRFRDSARNLRETRFHVTASAGGFLGAALTVTDDHRWKIVSVYRGGPADRAGIKKGDEVLDLQQNGVAMSPSAEMRIPQLVPGGLVDLKLGRGEEVLTLQILTTDWPR